MKTTPTPSLATRPATPYEAAESLIDWVRYELPAGKSDAYWTDRLANCYAVLHSNYQSGGFRPAYLAEYIRRDAWGLLAMLKLTDLHPIRRRYVLARLELDIAALANANQSVVLALLETQKARQDAAYDAYLAEVGPPDPPMNPALLHRTNEPIRRKPRSVRRLRNFYINPHGFLVWVSLVPFACLWFAYGLIVFVNTALSWLFS